MCACTACTYMFILFIFMIVGGTCAMHVHRGQRTTLGVDLYLLLWVGSLLTTAYASLAGLWVSRVSPVSASQLTVGAQSFREMPVWPCMGSEALNLGPYAPVTNVFPTTAICPHQCRAFLFSYYYWMWAVSPPTFRVRNGTFVGLLISLTWYPLKGD